MTNTVILDENEMLVHASKRANADAAVRELKAKARQLYYHPSSVRDMICAKKILDAINEREYAISKEERNTVYLFI